MKKAKRILSLILCLALCLSLLPVNVLAAEAERDKRTEDEANGAGPWNESVVMTGSGTAENPFQISNLDELLLFAAMVNGTGDYAGNAQSDLCAKLTADVDATSLSSWTPIGNTEVGYSGSFDGQGHSVMLTMQGSTAYYQGLFGYVHNGTVENLHVAGSIQSNSEDVTAVGGVAGCLNGGTVQNCYGSVAINVSCDAGGVVGCMTSGNVTNCYNTGTVEGASDAGGVAGTLIGGSVTGCYNTGTVSGVYSGGIAGNLSGGSLTNCYNTGAIDGINAGGVAGWLSGGSLTNCYNAGSVEGDIDAGGVVGFTDSGSVTNCYYDKTLCNTVTGAINGADHTANSVRGLTTTQMTGAAALTNMGGFGEPWGLTGAYPKLKPYTAPTLAALTTDAEGNYLIRNTDDWNTLAEIVFGGADLSGKTFKQTADFTVGVVLGCADYPFNGSYDGDGHTLTLTLEDQEQDFVAPFSRVNAAKIRHLCVTGTVSGKMHCAGLVGGVYGGKTVIDDCLIDVAVASSGSHCGGVIGHAGHCENVVCGCVFTGSIEADKTAATFWGWSDDGAEGGLISCLDLSDSLYPIGLGYGDLTTSNSFYTKDGKQAGLGRPWAEANRGSLAYTVTAGTAVQLGFQSGYAVNLGSTLAGLTGGVPGLLRSNTIYAPADWTLHLKLIYTGAEAFEGFRASAGTLTEVDGGYTLLMPAQDVSITAVIPTQASTWQELSDALQAGGTILLTADVSPDNPYFADALVVPTGVSATLDLNGHIVDRGMTEVNSWHGGVIEINGGSLTVIDSDPTAAHESAVSYEDPLTGESVTVLGGVITGGWPDQYGGGVCVKGGSFTLTGGSIVGNHVGKTGFGAVEALGGGVYVQSGSFTMNGGAICGNQAVNKSFMPEMLGRGGGIYIRDGSFTMNGGTIRGNAAGNQGGGVYLATPNSGCDGSMNVSGGVTVTGNAVQGAASNVYLEEGGKLTVTDALTGSIGVTMQTPGVFTDGLPGHGTEANFSSDDPGYILSLTDDGEAQLAEEFYPLWIAGVQFSSANRTVDATDNAAISSGTAVYDRESNTLTLMDFVYSGVGSLGKHQIFSVLCYTENGKEFTLALVGENSLTQTGVENGYSSKAVFLENRTTATIYSENGGSLRAEGGPVENGSSSSGGFSIGINISYSDLVIDGANVTAVGGTARDYSKGIEIDRYFTLNSGSLTAVGGQTIRFDSFGIQTGTQGFTVHGGTLTALGGNANRDSYGVYGFNTDITTVTGGRFVAQGATKAIKDVAALSADGLSVLAGEDAASAVLVTGDGWKDKKYVAVLSPVTYLDPTDADEPEKSCAVYTPLTDQTTLSDGWYVLSESATIDTRVTVTGEVHLILCDGATLTAPKGVSVNEGNSLTLWAQSSGDGMGKLFAGTDGTTDAEGNYNRTCDEGDAAIGGNDHQAAGSITVNGGTVTANGCEGGAGIGGGYGGGGDTVTINGGIVTATGGNGAAGIGGGFGRAGGTVMITDGTVKATGGSVNIYIGAGIGGGSYGNGGKVTIIGGTVTAIAGNANAQAIGQGSNATDEGSLSIPGMKVYADETATTPVPAGERVSTCRSEYAKLELCEPHVDADEDHFCDLCGCFFGPVSYLDPTDENEPNKTCAEYTVLRDQTTLTAGWYVVAPGALTIDERVTVTGEVHLILCDGATLTAPKGVSVNEGNSLTLWAQSSGDGMGKLFAGTDGTTDAEGNYNKTCDTYDAAIGGNDAQTAGSVTVNGGSVTAIANGGAGIGGGDYADGGSITVNGGSVTATGYDGAGIGGGAGGNGGEITISGGTVTATGEYGAGLGGGEFGDGGTVTITGGTVTATSGVSGAGIGGGSMRSGGVITITGGTVTATGRDGAGIGGGNHGSGGTVTITGGTVTATVTESISSNAQAIGRGTSYGYVGDPLTEGSLSIGGMKVYANKTATTPVPAGERESTCRGSYAELELCEPHVDEDENHFCDLCGCFFGPVSYLDPTDEDEPEKTCADYTELRDQTTLTEGWYVVAPGALTIDERVTVTGEVHLILCDGATLTAPKGVSVNEGNSLTLWAQSSGDGMGKLFAGTDGTTDAQGNYNRTCNEQDAAIGGNDEQTAGSITVNGGFVTAIGDDGAGIGGGENGDGGTVTITGGTVTATGGLFGAGIGGGSGGSGGSVTITGGTVTATGGLFGAGIGGEYGDGGVITITGGTVTASGRKGAGIGGGENGDGGIITITGGTVTATSTNGQAIGHGENATDEGELEIPGMKVYANAAATVPVPAGERVSTCRSEYARLTLCEPHADEDENHECDHCGTAWLYIAEIDPLTYSGSVLTPELHVFFGTTELQAGTDYDVAYAQGSETVSPIKAGSYTVTVTGKGSCEKAGSVSGSFTVNPLALTVTANSDTKVYDGTPLTNDGYTHTTLGTGDSFASLTVTGSQTLVGFSSNVPSAAQLVNANGENVNACYAITYANGTLTVTQSEKALVISSATQSWVYDGQSHSANVYTLFYEGTEVNADSTGTVFPLPTGDTVTITPTASPVTNYDTSYDSNNTYTYVLTNANCYANVQASYGTLHITKRSATVTAHPQTVEQGRPIATGTEQAVLTGAVEGHVLSAVTLTDSGTDTITDDGVITPSAATVSDAQGTDVTANYELSYADGVLTVTDHAWGDWETTVAPTCTESGEEKRSCANCDAFQTRPVDPLGHDLVHHDAQAPTCTAIGWEAYDTCSRCAYTTYAEIPALGHDLVHHDAQEPTCTEIGWEAYDTCSRCAYTTYAELPALGHDLVHHDAQEPTCTAIGWEAYDTCARCDYTTYAELPALGHDLVHHDAQGPTCTEIGWEAYDTCSRCDYTTYVEREAIGHEWGAPSYEWSDDLGSVTASAVCAHDPTHILSETVPTDFVIIKPSTFELTGIGYYQATFANELFQTQKQEVVIPEVACAGGDECPSQHFTDLPPITNYAHVPIDWAVVNHITGGTSATTFSPNATCTRAQFVTFLWRVAGSPEPDTEHNPFKDVKKKAWYYKSVLWAAQSGITGGTSATTFSPGATCTRAQVVTFLWRYSESPEPTIAENPFEDVKSKAYYYKAVLWAVENKITGGTGATTFTPDGDCTRAQVMTFLYRRFGQ